MGLLRQPTSDITKGVIWKQLLAFFFPLWFGTFFQQLYNTVDTLVVGRFVGKVALAAVGSTSVIVNLTVGIFTGLAAGAVVAIAQHFGARRWDEVHECVHTAMLLSILIGAFFMVTGFVLTPWALRAMGTTEEALPGAILYLRVYFLGMVPNVIYNMGTGVLRAIGDFRRPLYFLMAASLCNIVLDLLLVVVFHMGVAGVAIATICSQLLSAVLVVISLMRSEMTPYQLFPKRLRIYAMPMRSILMIGVPTALQSVMYNASNIVIQASINSFGTDAVAAWTAYGKMDIIFWMTITAMAQSITTFAGQNYGAGEYERLKKGVRGIGGHDGGLHHPAQHRLLPAGPAPAGHLLPRPRRTGGGGGDGALPGPLLYHLYSHRAAHWSHPGGGQVGSPHAHLGLRGMRPAAAVPVHRRARPPHPAGCGGQLPHHLGGHLRGHPALLPLRPVAPPAQEGVKAPLPYFAGGRRHCRAVGAGAHTPPRSICGRIGGPMWASAPTLFRRRNDTRRIAGAGPVPAAGLGRAATRAAPTFGGSGTIAEM